MPQIKITKQAGLLDFERELTRVTGSGDPFEVLLARQRDHQFFKDAALAQFLASMSRIRGYSLVDWHNVWKEAEVKEHYGQNLAGLFGALLAQKLANLDGVVSPLQAPEFRKDILDRYGLLKPFGPGSSNVRDLSFLGFDPEHREIDALSGGVTNQDLFIRQFQKWKERLLDLTPDTQPDLFGVERAPRPLMEFLHELYQNGAEHGNRGRDNELIPGLRAVCMRRHNLGSVAQLDGFIGEFQELEDYFKEWGRKNKGITFIEVAVVDMGLGILDRFVATRPEFANYSRTRAERLSLLLRILLTPPNSDSSATYNQAYSSKDVGGDERGAGRGLERALEAVRKLNGFVSLRTAEFWLHRGFPNGEEIGQTAMREVAGGPFAHVAGTCFTALFPSSLRT